MILRAFSFFRCHMNFRLFSPCLSLLTRTLRIIIGWQTKRQQRNNSVICKIHYIQRIQRYSVAPLNFEGPHQTKDEKVTLDLEPPMLAIHVEKKHVVLDTVHAYTRDERELR